MARKAQQSAQPAQSNTNAATGDETPSNVAVLAAIAGKGTRKSGLAFFSDVATEKTQQAAAKLTVIQDAKQRLAEAHDLYQAGADKSGEANDIAAKAGIALYKARTAGTISAEEVSAALGDVFGYKVKGEPQAGASGVTGGVPKDYDKNGQKASATPYGEGEQLRKRIVRAVAAFEFATGGDGGRFFEGVPPETTDDKGATVADILDGMESGAIPFWSAYERLAGIKRAATVRNDPAFDPKRVAKMVESLGKEGAAAIFAESPLLREAYAELIATLAIVGQEAAALQETEAAE